MTTIKRNIWDVLKDLRFSIKYGLLCTLTAEDCKVLMEYIEKCEESDGS